MLAKRASSFQYVATTSPSATLHFYTGKSKQLQRQKIHQPFFFFFFTFSLVNSTLVALFHVHTHTLQKKTHLKPCAWCSFFVTSDMKPRNLVTGQNHWLAYLSRQCLFLNLTLSKGQKNMRRRESTAISQPSSSLSHIFFFLFPQCRFVLRVLV